MTDAVATALAALAVLLQVLVAVVLLTALASLVLAPARHALAEMRDTLLGGELWLAWGIAVVATLGSLYFSEIAHFEPCRLCWFQRVCMYPLAVILLGLALRRDARNALLYALPFPIAGIGVGLYHEYVTYNPEAESEGCRQGVSCTTRWIDEFGYITIPTLALSAFAAIVVLLAFAHSRRATEG